MLNAITNFTTRFCSSNGAATLFRGSIIFFSILVGACREDNLELGEGLIPYNQIVTTLIDSSIKVKTYIIGGDTLATNRCGAYYWGAKSDGLGATRAEFAAQFMPTTISDSLFAQGVSVDSLVLTFAVKSSLGEDSVQQMTIYTLKRRLFADSVYYSDFDVAELKNDSLTTVEFAGRKSEYACRIYVADSVSESVQRFVESLIDSSGGVYRNRSAFYDRFPGLFFGRVSGQSGMVYQFDAEKMKMSLYYKTRYTRSDTSLRVDYLFADGQNSTNGGVSHIEFDYANTQFKSQIGDSTEGATLCPVQSLGGLKSVFVVEQSQIDELKRHFVESGSLNVAILDAELCFNFESYTDSSLSQAISPIGLFREFRCYDSKYVYLSGSSDSKNTVLNSTTGQYKIKLTSAVNEMLNGRVGEQRIIMAPQPADNLYSLSQVVLVGAGRGRMPELRLMIALIGRRDN